MRRRRSVITIVAFALTFAAADLRAADRLTPRQQQGRELFHANCILCHGERGQATVLLEKRLGKENSLLEERTNLNAALIHHAVRHGINSMPWFRRSELTDADVDAIAAYLTRTR